MANGSTDHEADRAQLAALAAEGRLIAYFGYGSLVNRATLRTAAIAAHPARLLGWRRQWQPRPSFAPIRHDVPPLSLLTVTRAGDHTVDGVIVFDLIESLEALDLREANYRRIELGKADYVLADDAVFPDCPVYVYEAHDPEPSGEDSHPILRSYLDAVLQGYLHVYGEEGLRAFVEGTHGFHGRLHDDRHDPVYPRAVKLDQAEQELIDRLLDRLPSSKSR